MGRIARKGCRLLHTAKRGQRCRLFVRRGCVDSLHLVWLLSPARLRGWVVEPCARPGALLCVPSPCIVILGFPQFKRHNSGNSTTGRAMRRRRWCHNRKNRARGGRGACPRVLPWGRKKHLGFWELGRTQASASMASLASASIRASRASNLSRSAALDAYSSSTLTTASGSR